MNPEYFYTLTLENITEEELDTLSSFCFEWGALGTEEVLSFTQPSLVYDAEVVPQKIHTMKVYFQNSPNPQFLEDLKSQYPSVLFNVQSEENKDWLLEWKKTFRPFQLINEFWVVPSWLEVPKQAEVALRIDPGMAFGTGTHETTQLASELIYEITKSNQLDSVIDVGSGTGILAMLSYHRGVSQVKAIDIDPEARRVAKENLIHNALPESWVTDQLSNDIQESFDLVIANIIDGVLVQIRQDLDRMLAPQGHMVLSGILFEREAWFKEHFIEALQYKIIKRVSKNEWVAFWCMRS